MEIATKGPGMDWNPDNGLPNRYELWKRECTLLFETLLFDEKKQQNNISVQCYSGDRDLELFNSWTLSRHKLYCLKQLT